MRWVSNNNHTWLLGTLRSDTLEVNLVIASLS